jgi:hypothetical protein
MISTAKGAAGEMAQQMTDLGTLDDDSVRWQVDSPSQSGSTAQHLYMAM